MKEMLSTMKEPLHHFIIFTHHLHSRGLIKIEREKAGCNDRNVVKNERTSASFHQFHSSLALKRAPTTATLSPQKRCAVWRDRAYGSQLGMCEGCVKIHARGKPPGGERGIETEFASCHQNTRLSTWSQHWHALEG